MTSSIPPCYQGIWSGSTPSKCDCNKGWYGEHCDQRVENCYNGGTWSKIANVCSCSEEWTGPLCLIPVCKNKGHVIPVKIYNDSSSIPHSRCRCPFPFDGPHCEIRGKCWARNPVGAYWDGDVCRCNWLLFREPPECVHFETWFTVTCCLLVLCLLGVYIICNRSGIKKWCRNLNRTSSIDRLLQDDPLAGFYYAYEYGQYANRNSAISTCNDQYSECLQKLSKPSEKETTLDLIGRRYPPPSLRPDDSALHQLAMYSIYDVVKGIGIEIDDETSNEEAGSVAEDGSYETSHLSGEAQ